MTPPTSPVQHELMPGIARGTGRGRVPCSEPDCTKGRNRKCDREMCKPHCVAAGGCSHNEHPAPPPTAAPSPSPSRSNSLPPAVDTPPYAAHRRRASSESAAYGPSAGSIHFQRPQRLPATPTPAAPTPAIPAAPVAPATSKPKSRPTHASHINGDVFDKEHQRIEQQRARERDCSANTLDIARRATQHIMFYCWLSVRSQWYC